MKLYHFAPDHFLESILANGLTNGQLPILDINGKLINFYSPCQWLTKEGDREKQSWATVNLLPYSRTTVRLSISIPKSKRHLLWRAQDYLPNLSPGTQKIITDWEGSENWYLFFGKIPGGWIRDTQKLAV